MDKLRALEYFVAAAREGSFSAAARRLDVSTPAVARLITALETSLGVQLLHRTVQGIALTADGASYLEACKPVLQQLRAADESVTGAAVRAQGMLVVGVPPFLSQHCILPALPAFHARYPDIQLDIRTVDLVTAPEAQAADILLLYGWQSHAEMVNRRVAQTRSLICASPAYWAAHGMPQRPRDLEHHNCLLFRDQEETILDFWEYERNGDKEGVTVSGWLVSDHRDVLLDAALAGTGVARFSDLSISSHLRSARLVPALLDWETKHAPPINLMFRASQRGTPRVRVFVDYLVALFAELEQQRVPAPTGPLPAERPHWYKRRHGRASASPRVKE
ncbi:LysR family transcriptional regulator [Lacisediminimonas sp.]|uniref:LysR family transcriptional regulator n=1 Tax=Lacisediminimonas sp. TaxID=3060582 RepID=UPI00271D979A|nr:LysR family transcriptional regulator [Lacisediminimonas sp.]MDO8301205.1 LysR family transcriptional regulator [Lacisediminimonas sp.]